MWAEAQAFVINAAFAKDIHFALQMPRNILTLLLIFG